ncbi:MAG: bacterial transcriptional activator domain-containing protein [Anaerolineae bacterium]
MNLNSLTDLPFQTFQEQARDARLILLHPRSHYRSLLVARLITSTDPQVLYYAMGTDDIDLRSFIAGITHDLANQHPTFGRHINILPPNAFNNFELLVDTFAKDLGEVNDQLFYLILDEYDRSDTADDIQRFVERLVYRIPKNCKLIINSRTLPRLSWVALIAQKLAVLLEDEHMIKQDFYELEREGKHKLEVFALGPGQVLMNGKYIENWEGHLPRLLLFFALERPIITRSEICIAFWPELDMDQAVNVFHVTKRRLHKALDLDVLVHDGGYYRINPELVIQYDVIDFATILMDARTTSSDDRITRWQKAIDLYRGPFLQGHTDKWILERRADFRAGYLEALSEMARIRLGDDRPEHALSLFQRVLSEDSTREDIHREVMKLFAHLGRRSEAAAHYQRLVDELKRNNKAPEEETTELYNRIIS